MRRLSIAEVHAQKVRELGLDPTALDLTAVESISGALRRAASFLCPCSAATLVRAVIGPLRGLVSDLEASKDVVEETLEAIIAHGDVLELRELDELTGKSKTLLYAAPPSFVARQSGLIILLGIAADQLSPLPDDLEHRIDYVGHIRRLRPSPGEDLRRDLKQFGLIELSYEAWLQSPKPKLAVKHVANNDRVLDTALASRDISGLFILNSERPVRYYRGRWVESRSHSGRYIARRSQAYGADLWCYVLLQSGQPERMFDMPRVLNRWRGCDEAWWLQMAIDATRGEPQRYRVRKGSGETTILELFSPVPGWARRRWDAIGDPLPSPGCLFAYGFSKGEIEEELQFAREALWLKELAAHSQR
jgi:hypothetical protein